MIVVGDVHGDLNQFIYPLIEFLNNRNKYKRIIYLGDYIDRGNSNAVIYEIVNHFKDDKNIIFLRGNHEFYPCTYDSMRRFNRSHVMYSFVLPLFKELHLPIVYVHDGIVFSHCCLRHLTLDKVKSINKMSETDQYNMTICNRNDENDKNEFKNIYGHEHVHNNDWDTKGLACIDYDSSYGFRIKSQSIFSLPRYAILTDNTLSIVKLPKISIGSSNDYNSKSLQDINKELKLKLKFEQTYNEFISAMHYPTTYKQVFSIVHDLYSNKLTIGEKNYFNDIPYEFYIKLGYDNTTHKPPDEMYREIVGNDEINGGNEVTTGYNYMHLIIMTIIVCVIIVFSVIITYTYTARKKVNELLK